MKTNYTAQGKLTPSELRTLQGIADHYGNFDKVAKSQCVAITTVKTHVNNIYSKFHVRDKVGAVLEGLKRGLIKVDGISRVEGWMNDPAHF